MVEISYISTSSNTASSTSYISVSVPAGVQDDDLLVAFVGSGGSALNYATGWTLVGNWDSFAAFYKIASSESGPYEFGQISPSKIRAQVCCYRGGFDTADPVDVISATPYNNLDTILRAAGVTVSAANSNIIFWGGASQSSALTYTPPINPLTFVEDVDDGDTTSDMWFEFAHRQWTGSGSTGNMDATISASRSYKFAVALVLNPTPIIGNPVMVSMSV
jgi:hypothetical protein